MWPCISCKANIDSEDLYCPRCGVSQVGGEKIEPLQFNKKDGDLFSVCSLKNCNANSVIRCHGHHFCELHKVELQFGSRLMLDIDYSSPGKDTLAMDRMQYLQAISIGLRGINKLVNQIQEVTQIRLTRERVEQ